jgi:hypothetical protein
VNGLSTTVCSMRGLKKIDEPFSFPDDAGGDDEVACKVCDVTALGIWDDAGTEIGADIWLLSGPDGMILIGLSRLCGAAGSPKPVRAGFSDRQPVVVLVTNSRQRAESMRFRVSLFKGFFS